MDQWTREIPVVAERGKITDCNGVVIADNDDTYSIFVRKSAVSDIDYLSAVLSDILQTEKQSVYDRISNAKSSEVTVKKQVGKQKISELLTYSLSGVYFSRDNTRTYKYGNFLSQVLGFTSADGYGQSGLELYYDKYMRGVNGEILYATDIVGKEISTGTPSYISAVDGLNVKLTVDAEIQLVCETVMERAITEHSAKTAEVIVMDPSTGEIKAMCIKPSFDLNNISRDNVAELFAISRNTLLSDVYEPGSTFKIITAAANVEEYNKGNINAFSCEHIFNSSRYRYIDGQRIKCWSNHEHGKHAALDLSGALNNSCNPIFVDIAVSLGKEKFYEYIDKFGFGSVTGIDFAGESQGMILPESAVKNVDLARIGFGQTIAVTPLQLAAAVSSVANGGYYYKPHLLSQIYANDGKIAEIVQPEIKSRTISKKTSEIMSEMLEKVVSEGSGKHAFIEGYRVAGKTGTAQKYENGAIAQGKYVSSFIGYFPANKPKYLALVIVDEPEGQYYGSTVAAPYAKEIFENIIRIKNIKASQE